MKQRVWIPGGHGMLGTRLAEVIAAAGVDVVVTARAQVDVTQREAVLEFARSERPSLIVNCTAYTAVDKAESEPALAEAGNADAPAFIGAAAREIGARALHVSTDYVFAGVGSRPLKEDDATGPVSVYGKSKLRGEERFLEATAGAGLVVRTSWLYGPKGKNFVSTMLKLMAEREQLKVVADQRGRPTSTSTLADRLWKLAALDATGIVHVADAAGPTGISWHEFAVAIHAGAKARGLPIKATTIEAIPTSAYPTPAVRPAWSVLDCSRCESLTGPLPLWTTTLDAFLDLQKS
ncbi:MAG: dTDP-4-dehydrorhamnose reductase [Deltaproteobacteria bacterium]|nr:dTDP-4-dehydrorhamnose reductase [Deltaproteobacteria bacterium]